MKIIIEINSISELNELKDLLNRVHYDNKKTDMIDMNESISFFKFTVRTHNCLVSIGINTIDELLKHSEKDLKSLSSNKNTSIGNLTLREINSRLSFFDLKLKK
jgi:DNA-directed RNA polymerase alpha subunit